ncbi:hypothetical protein XENTR_v10016777 [Xenopus tropicalis]|uniref:Cadherin-12 n=2 Tax=Xenopus tropicalis TaxID=8364 RepID=A0A6I8SJ07_XENTR|nr:hypothetical protein XENTR_v10016777 [Xenopus tropicalis]
MVWIIHVWPNIERTHTTESITECGDTIPACNMMRWSTLMLLIGEISFMSLHVFCKDVINCTFQKDQTSYHRRAKRGWLWNPFYVLEEQEITEPLYIGQLKSDLDKQDGSFKYILLGDGAKTIFTIDERTGKIYLLKKLDREEKSSYTLRAQAINTVTGVPVEAESEFIVKVQDINDNEPKFINEPYFATVPEMSPEGTFVTQVTATDMDDPNYGNSARLVYSILQGQPHFSIEPKSGIIRVVSQMDREAKDLYFVVIQAKDMAGSVGGLSTTTTVTVSLSDVNDNAPKFQQKIYDMSILETSLVGEIVGMVMADDRDIGKNAEMTYKIEEKGDFSIFDIITDNLTQEGIIILRKTLDYESKKRYSIRVKAINKHIDERFLKHGLFEDTTTVKIHVEDIDEPAVFGLKEYFMEILENAPTGSYVGSVTAKDPDNINTPVRYGLHQSKHVGLFYIDLHLGAITTTKPLDREEALWYNVTVTATEATNSAHVSEVPVYIRIIDVNDNAPQLSEEYRIYVCEQSKPREPIQIISAVDRDEATAGQQFSFTLLPEASNNTNFTVRDNKDNTATIYALRDEFNLHETPHFYFEIVINDNGIPPLSSTNTLTIHVCDCGVDGNTEFCKDNGMFLYLGLNFGALIAIGVCSFLILVLGFILLVKLKKKHTTLSEKSEDFRENIVKYDDEGGGEEDTEAFDIGHLTNQAILRKQKPRNRRFRTDIQSFYRMSLKLGPDIAVFKEFLLEKLEEANEDIESLPLDSLKTYAFEGTGSLAGSLSSIESAFSDIDPNIQNICDWKLQIQSFPETHREDDVLNQI